MVETLKTTLYAIYFMMTHYANCYVMSRQNKNQTQISEVLECKNDQMTFQKKKAAFFNCVHEAYMSLIHSRAAEMGEGQLALSPKLTRPAICKIKEECKALRYLEVFSMPWSTVHLFLVLLFRKNQKVPRYNFAPDPANCLVSPSSWQPPSNCLCPAEYQL